MKPKIDRNMLDMVPVKHERMDWRGKDDGTSQLLIHRNSPFLRFVRLFMRSAKVVTIDMDAYGTFVWKAMDGERNIHQIGQLLEQEFGEEVAPLYERLCKYMAIMNDNRFIRFLPQTETAK